MDWLAYLFYGFLSGLGQLMPVSAGAHDYFMELLTHFDTDRPLMRLFVHLASLAALFLFCRFRVTHIYREMGIAATPQKRRKRQPDMLAVLDGRVVLAMLLPAVVGLLLTGLAERLCTGVTFVSVLLLVSGFVIYLPHFLMTGNRDSRHISRAEATTLGIAAGLSAFPGISRMGMLLSVGGIRGFSRSYMLDIAFLLLIPLLAITVVLDVFALLAGGLVGMTFLLFLKSLLAGLAAFGGASLAIASMRFLSVNMGYTAFTYFNWGLGIFGFILYLMV